MANINSRESRIMINELATVEFCGNDFMVFWDGELYLDNMTHSEAVVLANKLNTEGVA